MAKYHKINVIPNSTGRNMVFMLARELIFVNNMRFVNFSSKYLAKNLPKMNKYQSQEFNVKQVEWVKQKEIYPCDCMYSFEKFD